jgi:protein-tyrosine phosphatase
MLSFLKKPSSFTPVSLVSFESDWHCHLLPQIDDGAKNEADTLEMLRAYVALGIQKIVATPHVRADFFKNTTQTIQAAAAKTRQLIEAHQLPLTLDVSAEYYADENFLELIVHDDLLPIEEQYVLFELPMQQPTMLAQKLVEKLQKKGYVPVLAHPERYRYWHGKPREWAFWKNEGVGFQLNLLSLTGYYGAAERRAAEQLLDADYIDAVGTDAHGARHLEKLAELNRSSYFKALQQLPLLNRLS